MLPLFLRRTTIGRSFKIEPNKVAKAKCFFDEALTNKFLEEEMNQISLTRGMVNENELIIAKGEVVEGLKLKKLSSLKEQYESELWQGTKFYFILVGYTILVALVLLMLLLFLRNYRFEIFTNNNKVTFIFFNIFLMVFVTTMVVKTDERFLYAVPLCILPLILKIFLMPDLVCLFTS